MAFDEKQYKMDFDKENYDTFLLRFPKGKKADLKDYAKTCGESINSLVIRCIEEVTKIDLSTKD